MDVPDEIHRILRKPGMKWTARDKEVFRVWAWGDDDKLRYLASFVAQVGRDLGLEQVQDCLHDFLVSYIPSLERVYDPDKVKTVPVSRDSSRTPYSCTPFGGHLMVSLGRFVRRYAGRNIRRDRSFDNGGKEFDPGSVPGTGESPLQQLERKDLRTALRECVRSLETGQRAAIQAFYFEEKGVREIATNGGVSVTTITSRMHRGRLALRKCLQEKGFNTSLLTR